MAASVEEYIARHQKKFVDELVDWLTIPSISTLPEHADDVYRAAQWAKEKLDKIGFPLVELIEGEGHPLVYGEWGGRQNQPTLLIYGHYDVQPVDPLSEWRSEPFAPRIDNDSIFARGASDDKGQVMIVLAALEALAKGGGGLPINIKILLEGEEEAGGAFVEKYVCSHIDRLRADAALICDTHMISKEQPSIISGLRGILYTEIHVRGAKSDLHSGSYGGVAPNPIHALCLLIARLKGEDGRIEVDGIYDSPVTVSEEERDFWEQSRERVKTSLLAEMGVTELVGEKGFSPSEILGIRPTLEVHGIRGGFTGSGAKTVIPAEALAKVSLRLPATMKPADVFPSFEKAVKAKMVAGYTIEVKNLHGGRGVSVSSDNTYIQAAVEAIEQIYGTKPVFSREGGSIPIAALLDAHLGIPVVLMGFGLPDDGVHGPNEKFSLSQFFKGIETVAGYLRILQR
jgi:acetylornithine deacetylase/succinyl-diaminopimelate desuccinylase-like protein